MARPLLDRATRFAVHKLLRHCGSATATLWLSWRRADGTTVRWPVRTTTTRQRAGLGVRHWALCFCGARRAVLHVYEDRLGCRACLGLAYPSSRERPARRALRRLQMIRERLGVSRSPVEPLRRKPKMRRKTFGGLLAREEKAWGEVESALDRFCGRLRRRSR